MPFAVTNFVGAISAATLGPLAKSKAQSPITKVRAPVVEVRQAVVSSSA